MNTTHELYDKECLDTTDKNHNMLVPWYLMAAYAYYVEDDPIITDVLYDKIVVKLIANWDEIEHRHKSLLDLESLKAGTYLGEYPSMVKGAVSSIRGGKSSGR